MGYTVQKLHKNLAKYRENVAKGLYASQDDLISCLVPSMREYKETACEVARLFPQLRKSHR